MRGSLNFICILLFYGKRNHDNFKKKTAAALMRMNVISISYF